MTHPDIKKINDMNASDRRGKKIINLVMLAEEIFGDPKFDLEESSAKAIEVVLAIIEMVARSKYESIGMLERAKDMFIDFYKEEMGNNIEMN